jgi:methanogenic corrinoid protein MtbC1
MKELYEEFLKQLEKGDKEKSVAIALKQLEEGSLKVHELYEDILAPALNSIGNEDEAQSIGVWEEHFRSSVVRTIIECCYPYSLKERDRQGIVRNGQRVIVICPEGEYHDIGARMAADYFTLAGFDAVFIGSSTPKGEFINMIETLKPQYVALSVISYYNLVSAKKTIESIHAKFGSSIRILAGGHVFFRNPEAISEIGADALVNTYEEIMNLGKVGC